MSELYSFDTVGKYSVVVESLDDERWQMTINIITETTNECMMYRTFDAPELARLWGMDKAESLGASHD